jgi:integrase
LVARIASRAEVLLWPGRWHERAARMLRRELEAARKKWLDAEGLDPAERTRREESDVLKPVDGYGRVFDFHGLRHMFISNLAAAGVHPKEVQQLARHSTISLTMDRYTHLQKVNVTGALDKLPDLPTSTPSTDTAAAVLLTTGTDVKSLGPILAPYWPRIGPF